MAFLFCYKLYDLNNEHSLHKLSRIELNSALWLDIKTMKIYLTFDDIGIDKKY